MNLERFLFFGTILQPNEIIDKKNDGDDGSRTCILMVISITYDLDPPLLQNQARNMLTILHNFSDQNSYGIITDTFIALAAS